MAASLSRPDPSSPASVAEAAFNTARRGFQTDEVRAFLVAVAAEMGRLQERERQLEAELRAAREVEPPADLDDETVAKLLGEETLRVLHTARESASQIKIRAEDTAARILREAHDEANRLRQDADVETARSRQDAASDAEAEVALAKQQGREMVNEARAYRERVLADLERRTTLARHQIEELINGRDRLLQVFERARLVAVDVTSELGAIDSPDELVNLTATTGPVPIMLPNARRPAPPADPGEAPATSESTGDTDDSTDGSSDASDTPKPDPDAYDDASNSAEDDAPDNDAEVEVDTEADIDDSSADDVPIEVDSEAISDETPDKPDRDTSPADANEAHVDHDADQNDDVVDDTDALSAGDPGTKPDTNVVSLFRGRPAPADVAAADEHPSTDTDEGGDSVEADDSVESERHGSEATARPDVGGIFERLRDEVPQGEVADETAANAAPESSDETTEPGEPEPNAFTRRDEALVPLIVAGARRVKRVLADEQNDALDTLRQGEAVTSIDDLVPAVDEHVSAYLAALDDELQSAAAAGAGELGVNDTKTLRKKLAKSGALTVATAHVRSALVTPLRDRLERAIGDGDGVNDDITKRVRAVYREWKTQHIDDQLDDVFRSAYNGGLHGAVESGTQLVWTTDPRLTPCPDCEDNSLAGAVTAGDDFPTGHAAAPAHPGCTCLALPSG